jgi:myo-inositol 2-dehydrogenase / D-chiro-inositol 1-dehydrogenase
MRKLSAAVIGAGPVGEIHARALSRHPSVRLVAVCGRTHGRVDRLAERLGVHAVVGVNELFAGGGPDVVCIATGNDQHVEPTLAAIEAGSHVFVEKPLAWRLEEARHVIAAARTRGVRVGVNFNHRFSEPYRRAVEFARDGGLGAVAYVAMRFTGDLYPILNDPYCMLIETQGHSFDTMRLFAGEIDEVATFLADPRGIGTFTSAAVAVRFASGAVGTLLGSWDSSYDRPQAVTFEAAGTKGAVQVDDIIDAVRLFRTGSEGHEEWRPGIFRSDRRDFWSTIDRHIAAFVDAILNDQEPPVDGEDGLRALELTYASIRSFEEGRPIETAVRG